MNSSTVLVSWYGKIVNRKNVNSSTVLVSWYEYERVEDRLPMCRGCVGGCRNDSLVLTLVRQKKTTFKRGLF